LQWDHLERMSEFRPSSLLQRPSAGNVPLRAKILFSYAHLLPGVILAALPVLGLRGLSHSGLNPARRGVLRGLGVPMLISLDPKSRPPAVLRCIVGVLYSGEAVRDGGVDLA
jgi:hypothetical protein